MVVQSKHAPAGTRHRPGLGYKVLAVLSLSALTLQTGLLLRALFEPPLPYRITDAGSQSITSEEFVRLLTANTSGALYPDNRVDVLTNGESFYAAEIEAIKAAKKYVHVECYIFEEGRVTDQVIGALEERARAGVQVKLLIDALGSAAFPKGKLNTLQEAGGKVAWYHPVRFFSWPRANYRTHRELVIADGTVAFIGGAGFADQWLFSTERNPRWRDTMVRIEGEAATGLAVSFGENWLEASGEILADPSLFPFRKGPAASKALVVTSSPTTGRSTEARILFQMLAAKATKSIHINTPYFLPDKGFRDEIVKAMKERSVEVTIIVPGRQTDHALTRGSSRSLYGDLLLGGARIFEYGPAMMHAKTMTVDTTWAVVGSTNLDSRSFGINDEVNVAIPDPSVAKRLEADFASDLAKSRQISYEEWKRRPMWERIWEWFAWLLLNQQ